jgi:hypothetical protein
MPSWYRDWIRESLTVSTRISPSTYVRGEPRKVREKRPVGLLVRAVVALTTTRLSVALFHLLFGAASEHGLYGPDSTQRRARRLQRGGPLRRIRFVLCVDYEAALKGRRNVL